VLGLSALFTMPRREDPKITIRQGLVLALYPGATAEQVEQQVARRVERRLFARAEVNKAKTYTTSRPGLFVANVELADGVRRPGEFWATLRHDLNESAALDLPPGVVGPIVDANFGDVAAVLLAVRAPTAATARASCAPSSTAWRTRRAPCRPPPRCAAGASRRRSWPSPCAPSGSRSTACRRRSSSARCEPATPP
jgi:multidrug efflux pump subunit AcrB